MHIFVYFFDVQMLLSYILFALIWLVMSWSEPWERNITPLLKKTFFAHKLQHPLLLKKNKILTSDVITHAKSINSLTKTTESAEYVDAIKENFNIKDKGLVANYRDAKKSTAYSLQWMEVIIDWFEKIRNLITWADPKMT